MTEVIATALLTSKAVKILRSITNQENLNQQLLAPVYSVGKFPPDLKAADQLNIKDISSVQHRNFARILLLKHFKKNMEEKRFLYTFVGKHLRITRFFV